MKGLTKLIKIFFGLILTIWINLASGKSATGDRLLILHDSEISYNDFSIFFDSFKNREYKITFKNIDVDDITLVKYEERTFDHLIMFLVKTKNNMEYKIPNSKIFEFISKGGNLLIGGSSTVSENIRNLVSELGIFMAEKDTVITDHFSYDKSDSDKHAMLLVNNFKKNSYILSDKVIKGSPILYRGTGCSLGNGQLLIPILGAGRTAYTYNTKKELDIVKEPWVAGTQTSLITGFQARNNARIIVTGSIEMFSNNFFNSYIKKNVKSGNQNFAEDITQWLFQEKSVLKVVSIKHNLANKALDLVSPNIYKMKDNVVCNVSIKI